VERTRVLIHLIDGTQEDVVTAYKTIRKELKAYGHDIHKKPEIVALNKADAIPPEEIEEKMKALKKAAKGATLFTISAATGNNVRPLLWDVWKYVDEARQLRKEERHATAAG
jgi:GTP-binding protein